MRQNTEDKELVGKILAGNEAAFEELVKRYERQIFSLGLRMCGQRQDAEDMVQEVFLSALKGLGGFRFEVPVLSWLFRIAAHRCQRMHRLRSGQPKYPELLDAPAKDGGSKEAPPSKAPDSLSQLLEKEAKQNLEKAISRLPGELRLVLILRDLEEQSTEQAAKILKMSQAAVKSRLHRARMALKEEMRRASR